MSIESHTGAGPKSLEAFSRTGEVDVGQRIFEPRIDEVRDVDARISAAMHTIKFHTYVHTVNQVRNARLAHDEDGRILLVAVSEIAFELRGGRAEVGLCSTDLVLLCKLWEGVTEKCFMRDVVGLFANAILKTNELFV